MTDFRYQSIDCEECNGNGEIYFDGPLVHGLYDSRVDRCEECGGSGDQPRLCGCCEDEAPLNDEGLCADCAAEFDEPVERQPAQTGVWL